MRTLALSHFSWQTILDREMKLPRSIAVLRERLPKRVGYGNQTRLERSRRDAEDKPAKSDDLKANDLEASRREFSH
jgi:hypothetical protein